VRTPSSDDGLLIVLPAKHRTASTLVKNVTQVNRTFCPSSLHRGMLTPFEKLTPFRRVKSDPWAGWLVTLRGLRLVQ
jgi:hypothetical protein